MNRAEPPRSPTPEGVRIVSEKKRAEAFQIVSRERAVHLVLGHCSEHASEWAVIRTVADRIGPKLPFKR